MSRTHYRPAFGGRQDAYHDVFERPATRTYGLGMSDVMFAEEMAWLRSVLNRGDFGSHESIQDWIEENIHPAFVDDALQIAANHP